eukprot:859083-Rhodomonas_salina.1
MTYRVPQLTLSGREHAPCAMGGAAAGEEHGSQSVVVQRVVTDLRTSGNGSFAVLLVTAEGSTAWGST